MIDSYSQAGVLWHGYMQAVRFNAPMEMQTRLLIAAESAEQIEVAIPEKQNDIWPDKPCTDQRTI